MLLHACHLLRCFCRNITELRCNYFGWVPLYFLFLEWMSPVYSTTISFAGIEILRIADEDNLTFLTLLFFICWDEVYVLLVGRFNFSFLHSQQLTELSVDLRIRIFLGIDPFYLVKALSFWLNFRSFVP